MINYDKFFLKTQKLSILLVEDYIPLRDEITELLEEFFPSVEVASNGEEALSIYKNFRDKGQNFNIIISDIEMPIKNGVELSKEIYSINPKQHIIILSSHTNSKYLVEFINLGISQFITKPIDYETFIEILYKISSEIFLLQSDDEYKYIVKLDEDYIWDKESSVLKKNSIIVDLTKNEILFMKFIFSRLDYMCTNEDIINYFYSKNINISENSIRNLVFKLRKKLPSSTIDTIYGMGYKLKILI